MHRIDSNGAVDGKWQAGNPAIGQKATQIPADWMNAIQEALCYVIETAGITLEKGDDSQLYDAIIALLEGIVGDGGGAVPTTRKVLAAGLASGGGDLVADRTITVTKASAAEVTAQTRDDVAVTPLGLAGLVGLSVSGTAWIIKIGSVVMQVFDGVAQANTTTIISLPQAYTENNRGAWANGGSSDNDAKDNGPWVNGRGLTTVSVYSSIDAARSVQILSIGK
ncbi:hypothetical protein [uncultured Novosphingobium sp.]|uniref:hypothetical protein n=1 Tax=uncultured Novosphingobium sp. TaxID=292277 RepID=UPI00259AADDC|nr:hypothetical protein [uncultured Novosphingobium sp.]